MNTTFIETQCKEAKYQRKEGTAASYYWQEGSRILPNRMSISKDVELTPVAPKGRNLLHKTMGQMKGNFTQKEDSPLMQHKPFAIHTTLYQIPEYPEYPYGTIGITGSNGKITRQTDFGDVVVVKPLDSDWNWLEIFYFPSMGKNMDEVMSFIANRK